MHSVHTDIQTERERQFFLLGCDAGLETMRKAVLGKILRATGEAITRGDGLLVAALDDLANDIEHSWRKS
jgi:hypothetical protein